VEPQRGEYDRIQLGEWLAGTGFDLREIHPLAGDVSPRRYERLTAGDGTTAILALYPADHRATCVRFARTTAVLAGAGVPVPRVLAADCQRGWMLLQDLGEHTLAELRDRPWRELGAYFEQAAVLAARIAALPLDVVRDLNPPLDGALMLRELAQTRQLFLEPQGLLPPLAMPPLPATWSDPANPANPASPAPAPPGPRTLLDTALEELCGALAADPPVPCHRDYMARNLVPDGANGVAVLDHQDLRLGPPAYDLASLLNDSLFPPRELERRLVDAVFPTAAGRLRYHRAAAQRTLKAVGTYAAFARRGASRHLPLIAPTLRRFLRHFASVPEGAPLAPGLERAWGRVLG
jgi:aminoglycoside/choline kinase family phosphotransferase